MTDNYKDLLFLFRRIIQNNEGKLQLIGGSSIMMNIVDIVNSTAVHRPTKDLDFKTYIKGLENFDKDILANIDKAFREYPQYKLESRYTESGNVKLVITDLTTNKRIRADFEVQSDYLFDGKDIMSLEDSFRHKLILRIMDRRFKDIVDVLIILRNFYRTGISKSEILSILEGQDIDFNYLLLLILLSK